jgi:hypothetical protein
VKTAFRESFDSDLAEITQTALLRRISTPATPALCNKGLSSTPALRYLHTPDFES